MWGRAWVSALLMAVLTGCAPRARSSRFLPVLRVPLECAKEIRLVDCAVTFNPPHCPTATVTYARGGEQLVVVK
jgi:hypothetical protein